MNGFLIVNKPINMTSHDVINQLRKKFPNVKMGHLGTLDPDASGVLPICMGNATKLVDLLMNKDKSYDCEILLGIKTKTLDISGEVIESQQVNVDLGQIDEILKSLIGEQMQIPPMYSAVKINGKKLYEYARKDIEIERNPRKVFIYNLKRTSNLINNTFHFILECSKGFYVRTLCEEIASKLNTIGCMKSLNRLSSGPFLLKDAYTLENILNNQFQIIDTIEFLKTYPKFVVKDYLIDLINNGITLDERQLVINEPFVCYTNEGKILALYQPVQMNKYKPILIIKGD